MRAVIALVLCPPLGLFGIVLLLLAKRARERAVASERSALRNPGGSGNASKESASPGESMLEVAHAVILFGIIFGTICYATAAVVFVLTNALTGLGCDPCGNHVEKYCIMYCTVRCSMLYWSTRSN